MCGVVWKMAENVQASCGVISSILTSAFFSFSGPSPNVLFVTQKYVKVLPYFAKILP